MGAYFHLWSLDSTFCLFIITLLFEGFITFSVVWFKLLTVRLIPIWFCYIKLLWLLALYISWGLCYYSFPVLKMLIASIFILLIPLKKAFFKFYWIKCWLFSYYSFFRVDSASFYFNISIYFWYLPTISLTSNSILLLFIYTSFYL